MTDVPKRPRGRPPHNAEPLTSSKRAQLSRDRRKAAGAVEVRCFLSKEAGAKAAALVKAWDLVNFSDLFEGLVTAADPGKPPRVSKDRRRSPGPKSES